MSDDKKIYDRFNSEIQYMIIYAKAASIHANVDRIYPESLMAGLLTMGVNSVSKKLVDFNIDLEKALKIFKGNLLQRFKVEDENYSCESIKPDKIVREICQKACDIGDELGHSVIGVEHIFVGALGICSEIKNKFESLGLDVNNFNAQIFEDFEKSNVKKPKRRTESPRKKKESPQGCPLDSFCIDMTEKASENHYDPIMLRDQEIEEAITVLCRRNKSNPILVGEPGVGKTAVVEGICQRIVSKTVPDKLKDAKIFCLEMGTLVAGTKYRGEFENRLKAIVDSLKENDNYILFIDEIHNLVGAGSASGSVDAANMLKPELARGLKCIGATTHAEYKKIFSGDGALDRRFENINIDEPSAQDTIRIVNGMKNRLEEYHKCSITEDAIEMAVKLSERYKPDKHFPDKAIDCLDTACAKFAWHDDEKFDITNEDIAIVISKQCKIPLEIILWDNYERIQNTEKVLHENIKGQDHAIDAISRVLKNSYSGVRNPDRPIGVFVFGGQSGTGKTHTAKCLAKTIFDNELSFIRVDMSEYSESHSVSKITGSPPGYVGFQETNTLADKIRKRPYSVLLLDEIEKAHPKSIKLFLQAMKDGFYTDATGDKVNCKNLIMIMTGNFGMNEKPKPSLGFGGDVSNDKFQILEKQRIIDFCKQEYGAEFVNRVDEFIPFLPLEEKSLKDIIKINVNLLSQRIDRKNVEIQFHSSVYKELFNLMESDHGMNAMLIDRLLAKYLEPCIADAFLKIESSESNSFVISISVKDKKFISSKRQKKSSKNTK